MAKKTRASILQAAVAKHESSKVEQKQKRIQAEKALARFKKTTAGTSGNWMQKTQERRKPKPKSAPAVKKAPTAKKGEGTFAWLGRQLGMGDKKTARTKDIEKLKLGIKSDVQKRAARKAK